jgi:hypothetical protein
MDSHNCQRVVVDGAVKNEGDVQVGGFAPYPISYRSIIPKRGECENLYVPVCVSTSHIAYGSVRMEPVFMLLAQSSAVAAKMAIDGDGVAQNIDYTNLRARLLELGQVLDWDASKGGGDAVAAASVPPSSLPGVVLDDSRGVKAGTWVASTRAADRKVGTGYVHDGDARDGLASITFTPDLPAAGDYELVVIGPSNPNRATNTLVTIAVEERAPQSVRVSLKGDEGKSFHSAGLFRFHAGKKATITISNHGADGYVVVDGIQLLPSGERPTPQSSTP